jgi:xanthine dehydrogenase accessory factor
MNISIKKKRVVVRGAGEMASGVIHRLFTEGYRPVALEQPNPCCVRRYVCFAEAVYSGEIEIEGVKGKLAHGYDDSMKLEESDIVPIIIDPEAKFLKHYRPGILIDGRMLKKDIDSSMDLADLIIGLGPGFYPEHNCHIAIETNRGPDLGKVLSSEPPQEDTAVPAPVHGFTTERVLRAPVDGVISCRFKIGDFIKKGDTVAEVNGRAVRSEINGILRGICIDGLHVEKDQKIGDIDPRGMIELCHKISDKARMIAEGVLAAIKQYAEVKVHL